MCRFFVRRWPFFGFSPPPRQQKRRKQWFRLTETNKPNKQNKQNSGLLVSSFVCLIEPPNDRQRSRMTVIQHCNAKDCRQKGKHHLVTRSKVFAANSGFVQQLRHDRPFVRVCVQEDPTARYIRSQWQRGEGIGKRRRFQWKRQNWPPRSHSSSDRRLNSNPALGGTVLVVVLSKRRPGCSLTRPILLLIRTYQQAETHTYGHTYTQRERDSNITWPELVCGRQTVARLSRKGTRSASPRYVNETIVFA